MHEQQVVNAIRVEEGVQTISVQFNGSHKTYTYMTWYNDHKEDELVIVNGHQGYTVAKIVKVHEHTDIDPESTIHYKWIVNKIDDAEYDSRSEADYDARMRIKHDMRKSKVKDVLKDISKSTLKKIRGTK